MTAFALGPGFGAGISSLTDDPLFKGQLPMFCSSGLGLSAFLLAYFRLLDPADLKKKDDDAPGASGGDTATAATSSSSSKQDVEVKAKAPAGRGKMLLLIGLASFLKSANYNVFNSTFGFLVRDEFGLGSAFFAFAFTASGIVVILNNIVIFGWLRQRFGPMTIGAGAAVINAAGTVFIPHMPSYGAALGSLAVMIVGNGLIENVLPIVLSDLATGGNTARILAISSQCAWGGHIGGPPFFSALREQS